MTSAEGRVLTHWGLAASRFLERAVLVRGQMDITGCWWAGGRDCDVSSGFRHGIYWRRKTRRRKDRRWSWEMEGGRKEG